MGGAHVTSAVGQMLVGHGLVTRNQGRRPVSHTPFVDEQIFDCFC